MLSPEPRTLVDTILDDDRRILIFGEAGIGKSTAAMGMARTLAAARRACSCISVDPGSPAFGVPGALCRAEWQDRGWHIVDLEALCSLDAARFRLPLISALRRLVERSPSTALLIDPPGVVRGVAGAELLLGIAEAVRVDSALVFVREGRTLPLEKELKTLTAEVIAVEAAPEARQVSRRERARERTRLWDIYLNEAEEQWIPWDAFQPIGTPPPLTVPEAWAGRQVASLDKSMNTLALGEILTLEDERVRVRMPRLRARSRLFLVRDAQRTQDGLLSTARPKPSASLRSVTPPDMVPRPGLGSKGGSRPLTRVGLATVALVNGVFGDPLLHLRLRHQKRSILFDLGDAGRLPARIAHQVTDVFISHAHMDHVGGFLWLLRSRMGEFPPCRIYGPPGIATNIGSLLSGIHWDRIGDRGPRFDVAELHGERLVRFRLQAGLPKGQHLEDIDVPKGLLLDEPGFQIRAVTVDHGTPVLALAFDPSEQLNIRKDQLLARGLSAGPWLQELKHCIADGDRMRLIQLPDGSTEQAGVLADDLVLTTPGQKLVYATDLADTPDNRARLVALAKGAHTLFCEAPFVDADSKQAASTQHLTARACGEIATAAGVQRLIPFHFSRRYENEPARVYEEVRTACAQTVVPRWLEVGNP